MKVILVTGPQGSGNHIWSKVLTTWADKEFWVGHKDEPHSKLWENMDDWKTHTFTENTVISISIPYAVRGVTRTPDKKRVPIFFHDLQHLLNYSRLAQK